MSSKSKNRLSTGPGVPIFATGRNLLLAFAIGLMFVAQTATAQMKIGTNFWFLADWSGETPFGSTVNWSTAWANHANIWNPAFLNDVKIYNTFRFMDWNQTNTNHDSLWSQRALPTSGISPIMSPGKLPYEWQCDLCNRIGANLWLNIPFWANDDYINNLAALIKANLASPLKVYLEYANEIWLGGKGFNSDDVVSEAAAILGRGDYESWNAYRCLQIWQAFKTAFGSEADARVIRVIGGQLGNVGIQYGQKWVFKNTTLNPQNVWPNYYSDAPYISGHSAAELQNSIAQVMSSLRGDACDCIPWDDSMYHKHGVGLVCYEGGNDLSSDTNGVALTTDPSMYGVYTSLCDSLNAVGVKLFNHYTNTSECVSPQTCWGAKTSTGQDTNQAPKYRALMDWARAHNAGPEVPGGVNVGVRRGIEVSKATVVPNGVVLPSGTISQLSIVNLRGLVVYNRDNFQGGSSIILPERKSPGVYFLSMKVDGVSVVQRLTVSAH